MVYLNRFDLSSELDWGEGYHTPRLQHSSFHSATGIVPISSNFINILQDFEILKCDLHLWIDTWSILN